MHKALQFIQDNKRGFITLSIIAAVVVTLVVFGNAIKGFLQNMGLIKTGSEAATEKQEVKTLEKVKQEVEISGRKLYDGQPLTKPVNEWLEIADTLHQSMKFSSLDDNYETAVYQLCRVKNDADITKLIEVFGARQESYFGLFGAGKKTWCSLLQPI